MHELILIYQKIARTKILVIEQNMRLYFLLFTFMCWMIRCDIATLSKLIKEKNVQVLYIMFDTTLSS